MRWGKWLSVGFLLATSQISPVLAAEKISVCFNYGCLAQAEVLYSDAQLGKLALLLDSAQNAAEERNSIRLAVGQLLG